MGLVTGTAVATIYYSSVRLGLPVPTACFLPFVSLSRWVLGQWPQSWGESPSHRSYFRGECHHADGLRVGTEGLGTLASRGGRGGVVTLETLFLVILGSEYPGQARVGRQREKAPSWHTVLGQKSTDWRQDEVRVRWGLWPVIYHGRSRGREIPTRLWTCGPGAGGCTGICP